MNSLVLELQVDAINSSASTLNLLRKAFIVAKKLNVKELENWIDYELNGYSSVKAVPEYRIVTGQLKARNPYVGWIPVVLSADLDTPLSKRPISQPISEVENWVQTDTSSYLHLYFPKEVEIHLMNLVGEDFQPVVRISRSSLVSILESVRDRILRWALKLEEDGILGEGLSFSQIEKEIAATHNYQVFIGSALFGGTDMSTTQNNDFHGASIGGGISGRDYTGDVIHNHGAKQDLSEAAAEIQKLLKQLEQSYPTTTLTEKAAVAEMAIQQIETNPTLKAKAMGALKSAGKEAFKEAIDHPLVNILMAGIEGWQEGS
jgi:AbiTii